MGLPIVVVDAFTDTRFRGNPAAVCVLPEGRDDQFMKDVAREMNLSETAFLLRDADTWWKSRPRISSVRRCRIIRCCARSGPVE